VKNGNKTRQAAHAPINHLVSANGHRRIFRREPLVDNCEYSREQRRREADGETEPVTELELVNDPHRADHDDAGEEFGLAPAACPIHERFEK
jgi:hypothetical protein